MRDFGKIKYEFEQLLKDDVESFGGASKLAFGFMREFDAESIDDVTVGELNSFLEYYEGMDPEGEKDFIVYYGLDDELEYSSKYVAGSRHNLGDARRAMVKKHGKAARKWAICSVREV